MNAKHTQLFRSLARLPFLFGIRCGQLASGSIVVTGLAGVLICGTDEVAAQQTFFAELTGAANGRVAGFVPHGDPLVSGTATLTIYDNNTMDYDIVLEGDRYRVTQAHLYNINKTSGTSGSPAHGDSIICWGGRWQDGGDSDDFLQGTGYRNGRLGEVIADPTNWFLMLHTEGGHFAVDGDGGLIPFDPVLHETNELGVPENERSTRFNNRVGRRLDSLVLREDNDRDGAAPFQSPLDPTNWHDTPFPDASDRLWTEPDGQGGWQLTAAAVQQGYDLETDYLFYLYDDQGPLWDFGGPEGGLGGFLQDPFELAGDLNFDGLVDTVDWLALMAGYGTNLTGLGQVDAYQAGDLNLDGIHSLADIEFFRDAFVAAGGNPDELIWPGVPEPQGVILIVVSVLGALAARRGSAAAATHRQRNRRARPR